MWGWDKQLEEAGVKLHAVEAEEAAVRQQLEGGAGGDRCRDAEWGASMCGACVGMCGA